MNKGIKYWLCWLAVLPGALLAGLCATFPLHWILYSTLSNFVEPYPQLPERILTPFAISGVFVWSGCQIAPEYKIETSVVLFGLLIFVIGGFVFLTLSGGNWMGERLHFQGGGLATGMAIIGALTALYIVRKNQLTLLT